MGTLAIILSAQLQERRQKLKELNNSSSDSTART
jgi:hypothetical protein